ncbi:MAG: hypothetical protein JOY64_09315 [Alphaproteobacteria bacterium]|nr:hypothetical protein [Alphaproteobacteria bacterium]MBV8407816.1 hypothetical protein [Alphaproteobacteria bacterium]
MSLRSLLALPVILASALAAPARADCPLDLGHGTGWVVFSDHFMIAFRPDPMRIEVGQPFALLLNVCTRNGNPAELLGVEAELEDQGRRSKAAPTLASTGEGRYRADGLLFDAPGRWELDLDVRAGQDSERLTHEIILK